MLEKLAELLDDVGFVKGVGGRDRAWMLAVCDTGIQDGAHTSFCVSGSAKVKARYSFVYVFDDGAWKISHHHSLAMPEAPKGQRISKSEAKALFQKWNGALAALDSDKVAKRYAKGAVLLPTVSDIPRTDYESIKDYFGKAYCSKVTNILVMIGVKM